MFKLFGGKSVAGITASLGSIVEELKAHAADKQAEAQHHTEEAARLLAQREEAAGEVAKAKAAADKIASLLQ